MTQDTGRPHLFRRNFLINPKVQFQIIGYMLALFAISVVALYAGLRLIMEGIDGEFARMYPQQVELLQQLAESRRYLLNQVFTYFSGVSLLLALAGGILLSHRVVGPAYRIRKILEQVLENREPDTFKCRRSDYFREIFPLLERALSKRPRSGQDGFTLVELMIVVALIGILASMAASQFQRIVSRARQSEARLMLSGMYTAEMAFQAEYGSFTACLRQAGYEPTESAIRYYGGGFRNMGSDCGPQGNASCRAFSYTPLVLCNTSAGLLGLGAPITSSDTAYAPSAQAYQGSLVPTPLLLSLPRVSQNEFVVISLGSISPSSGSPDVWTINHEKAMVNVQTSL